MSHPHCRNQNLTDVLFKPTRLLFLQSEGENIRVRLHCTTEQLPAVPYMTLSHCWGGGSPLRLVKATITTFQQNIDTKQLPKTFLQAAQTVKYLGCSYLWIDSLCIIQDDRDDWLREAALMGQVYKNSVCNIAATDGADSSKGCFYARNPRAIQPEPFNDILGQTQYLVDKSDVFEHHVLYTRGWVLQEILLAPRVLHCCREQLYWHCDELRASEIFPNGMPASTSEDCHPVKRIRGIRSDGKQNILTSTALEKIASNVLHYAGSMTTPRWIEFPLAESADLDIYTSSFVILDKDSDITLENMEDVRRSLNNSLNSLWRPDIREKLRANHPFTHWAGLVQAYCSMSFTRAEDRAAAFSGIISLLRPHLGDYLVGLWKIFLPFELLWVTAEPSNRQKALRAPSWSWMSIGGSVGYSLCGHSVKLDQVLVEILSVSIDYISIDMSRASSWEMRLRGKLAIGEYKHRGNRRSKPVYMYCIGNPDWQAMSSGKYAEVILEAIDPNPPSIFLDEVEPVELYDGQFVFFLLIKDRNVGTKAQTGLVLRLVEDEQRYRRIGVFDSTNPTVQAIFDAVEPTEVILV